MDCKYCDSAMLCVNVERTIYRCQVCGRGVLLTELETTRKQRVTDDG